jgi:hypothetical protein
METTDAHPGENGYCTNSFRIGPSETGGLGMLAVQDIAKGTCIISEDNQVVSMAFLRQNPDLTRGTQWQPFLDRNEDLVMGGHNINRVNHSCSQWNAKLVVPVSGTTQELRAVKPIRMGDEITQFYKTEPVRHFRQPDGSGAPRAVTFIGRAWLRKLLKTQQGFTCACEDCAKDRKSCHHCGSLGDLKQCAKCGVNVYCGRECQVADWPSHKVCCRAYCATLQEMAQARTSRRES